MIKNSDQGSANRSGLYAYLFQNTT